MTFGASVLPDGSEWGPKPFLLKVVTLSGNEFSTWQRLKKGYSQTYFF